MTSILQVMVGALEFVAELVRIQKKAAEAVMYFDINVKASDMLSAVQQQHGLPVHRLKTERPQRFWTSTYSMFERMVEQYEAVNTVLCYLSKDHMCLCDDEVELIRSVLQVSERIIIVSHYTLQCLVQHTVSLTDIFLQDGVVSPMPDQFIGSFGSNLVCLVFCHFQCS